MLKRVGYVLGLSSLLCTLALSTGLVLSNIAPPVSAQPGTNTTSIYDAFAHEALTVSSTALGFTTATYAPTGEVTARQAFCNVESADIRYYYHGGTPTASLGHPAVSGSTFTIYGTNNIRNFRAIRSTTDSTVRCTFAR
jgi:hypothetical protein